MTEKFQDTSVENFHYSEQIEKYIVQFMAVFTGLKVSVGKNDFNSATNLVKVPIRYGSSDRVVAHIKAENTQNKMLRLPMLSAHVMGFSLAPERRKGTGQVDRRVKLKAGGVMPDDMVNVVRAVPVPYDLTLELAIYSSNMKQKLQILEQILVLFEPTLQLQLSDDSMDWLKITVIELMDITWEQNYPSGTNARLLQSNLLFKVPVWIAQPVNLKKNIVQNIKMRLDVINTTADVVEAVCDINNDTTPIDNDLINIDDLNIPPN